MAANDLLARVLFFGSVLLFAGFTLPSRAQEQEARKAGDALIPRCSFPAGLCGYVDRADRTVIEPRFDWADRFFEDRAAVRHAGKYGFIDRTGAIVVPLVYELVGNFSNGHAEILRQNKVGLIDTTGNIVIEPRFGRILALTADRFLVTTGAYRRRHFDRNSEEFADFRRLIEPPRNWGVLDRSQRWIVEPEMRDVRYFADGELFWEEYRDKSRNKWQLMRADGSSATAAIFDHVQSLRDDRAVVTVDGKRGALDGQGQWAIEPKFESLGYFDQGTALFREAGKVGMVDRNGHVVIPPIYDRLGRWNATRLQATRDGTVIWLDNSGQPASAPAPRPVAVKTTSDSPGHMCPDGTFRLAREGKWGLADRDGNFLISPRYDHLECFRRGLAWAAIPERREWCPIDKRGDIADRRCQCGQPLMIIEHGGKRPAAKAADCYQAGFDLLRPQR